jgi:DNA-binding XRE family transcriptional regulator
MAEEIGILRTSYTNIERGNKNPSIKVALKIKEILGEKEDLFADILEETE